MAHEHPSHSHVRFAAIPVLVAAPALAGTIQPGPVTANPPFGVRTDSKTRPPTVIADFDAATPGGAPFVLGIHSGCGHRQPRSDPSGHVCVRRAGQGLPASPEQVRKSEPQNRLAVLSTFNDGASSSSCPSRRRAGPAPSDWSPHHGTRPLANRRWSSAPARPRRTVCHHWNGPAKRRSKMSCHHVASSS